MELLLPLGQRILVLSDLWLDDTPTEASRAVAAQLAAVLRGWSGPGSVVICGGLLAPGQCSLADHHGLLEEIRTFTRPDDRRVVLLPSDHEVEVARRDPVAAQLSEAGIQVLDRLTVVAETAQGSRRVLLDPGPSRAGGRTEAPNVPRERPWLVGMDRLERPELSERFVASRLLYRRLGRFGWWLLVPIAVALLLRIPFVWSGLEHVFVGSGPRHALMRAHYASWRSRLATAAWITAVEVLAMAVVLAVLTRRIWVALGGDRLPAPWNDADGPDDPPTDAAGQRLEQARAAVAAGASGTVVGGALEAELVPMGHGFLAVPGGSTEIVRQHRGRLGLPPAFLHHVQWSSVELEAGADLHGRLVLADAVLPGARRLERLASAERPLPTRQATAVLQPEVVGSWPGGPGWPPPVSRIHEQRRARRVRRLAAAAILLTGLADLLVALTPPLRDRIHLVEQYLPLGVSQAAGALVALAGIALLMLARGVLRGQRRAWRVAVALLGGSLVLHLLRAADIDTLLLSFAVLGLLIVERRYFSAATDARATRSAVVTVVVGALAATVLGVVAIEVTGRAGREHLPSFPSVVLASAERLVGVDDVALPDRVQDFLGPAMLAVGVSLLVVCLYLATRPVVDRGLSSRWSAPGRRAAEARARDVVRRHGRGTLDYFALRDDKRWFFHRDSLVAYAVYGGICLVSPDPIGPVADRAQVWQAFRQYADRQGWGVGVMAAAEEWLPLYRESGMRHIYIGDEAVVDVPSFSLQGGHRKGLRQACSRLERYGYRVEFLDPATADPELARSVVHLMTLERRGETERGFSMCLSRVFDRRDTGLLMTVVFGPDGAPAAMCHFVPAPAIDGYSLDLMRRDPGEHPNGLIDYALCTTIAHLREQGCRGLSLNFAAMRSILEGDRDSTVQRVERWVMRRLSGVLPIESLWRFNAKYDPAWLPRYIVYESAERLVATVSAIARAESLSEVPVFGRFLTAAPPAPPPVDDVAEEAGGGAGPDAPLPRSPEPARSRS